MPRDEDAMHHSYILGSLMEPEVIHKLRIVLVLHESDAPSFSLPHPELIQSPLHFYLCSVSMYTGLGCSVAFISLLSFSSR